MNLYSNSIFKAEGQKEAITIAWLIQNITTLSEKITNLSLHSTDPNSPLKRGWAALAELLEFLEKVLNNELSETSISFPIEDKNQPPSPTF